MADWLFDYFGYNRRCEVNPSLTGTTVAFKRYIITLLFTILYI